MLGSMGSIWACMTGCRGSSWNPGSPVHGALAAQHRALMESFWFPREALGPLETLDLEEHLVIQDLLGPLDLQGHQDRLSRYVPIPAWAELFRDPAQGS